MLKPQFYQENLEFIYYCQKMSKFQDFTDWLTLRYKNEFGQTPNNVSSQGFLTRKMNCKSLSLRIKNLLC